MANIESEVSIELADQGTAIWGLSFAYAANRNTHARATLASVNRIPATWKGDSAGVAGTGAAASLMLLAQQLIEELPQHRPGHDALPGGKLLALVIDQECRCSHYRNLVPERLVLLDVSVKRA